VGAGATTPKGNTIQYLFAILSCFWAVSLHYCSDDETIGIFETNGTASIKKINKSGYYNSLPGIKSFMCTVLLITEYYFTSHFIIATFNNITFYHTVRHNTSRFSFVDLGEMSGVTPFKTLTHSNYR
jgi:hypothetical protein